MNRKTFLYGAWLVSLAALLGSLYFSNIRGFPPCVLCWYQRIMVYPLVLVLAVGIILKDRRTHLYVLPLSIGGMLIAVYHNLLYYNILPDSAAPCTLGISCTTKFIEWFGFVTIPLLSFLAFLLITIFMLLYGRPGKNS